MVTQNEDTAGAGVMGLDLKTHALDGKGGAGALQAEDDALKASQTGDVEELKKLLDTSERK